MSSPHPFSVPPSVGIIGFGAFGRLIARHLAPRLPVLAHDPFVSEAAFGDGAGAVRAGLRETARCPVVILATPVSRLAEAARAIAPHLRTGTLVADVGSVKVLPAAILRETLPPEVDILATHPLFGPQSARDGIRGLRIALCPVRGRRAPEAAAFLRRLGLTVLMTTPEAHDREMAAVQGLTHLIAKVLVEMEPLPTRMTTRSFDLIMQAVGMVRHDAPEVFAAIERLNPYAGAVRERFFGLAAELGAALAEGEAPMPAGRAARG
ncbi:prephenate dehydrogenase/arogenate dehydrogenase family protein [Methylobacterium sp. ID0610]|uniref:prephenate dehydrogenase/arogenate dehydrogenase family protein n=1 Tax=Methylobacterium carpenticola TaxID=3344827 RepID=UPI0036A8348D